MRRHFFRTSFFTLTLLSFSLSAFAQGTQEEAQGTQEEGSETPLRKMDLSVAPPDAPVQRTDFLHEGFYFRAGAGPGFLTTSVSGKDTDFSATDTSFSIGSDLMIGGSPAPGLAIGAEGLFDLGFAEDPSLAFLAGPFFDAHPYNRGGWHVGGMIGFAGTALGGEPSTTLFGGGASIFGGHDIWVAPEWSVGLGTRLNGSRVFGADYNATNVSLHFLITILNH